MSATQTVQQGIPAGTYAVDPVHSSVTFAITHNGVATFRSGFERYGLQKVGEIGEPFDPNRHEALVQLPKPDVTSNVVGDVIEVGYVLGDRLIRAAKVAVFTPEG